MPVDFPKSAGPPADIAVIDFNPQVNEGSRRRGVHVTYGDVSQPDVLQHAGLVNAELVISSLPNSLLKGSTNLILLRHLRELNDKARIIVHAERLDDVPRLYTAGASYVLTARLLEASHLLEIMAAAEKNLLHEKREQHQETLTQRDEIVP